MKHKNSFNKILVILFIFITTMFPNTIDATADDYSASFRVYKYGAKYESMKEPLDKYNLSNKVQRNAYIKAYREKGPNAWFEDYKNGQVEEITSATSLSPGDTFVVGVSLTTLDGSYNANQFALYYRYDDSLVEPLTVTPESNVESIVIDTQTVSTIFDGRVQWPDDGVFPADTWGTEVFNIDIPGMVSVTIRDKVTSDFAYFDYEGDMAFAYVVFKVKDTAPSGSKIDLEYIYESGTETLGSDEWGNARTVKLNDLKILSVAEEAKSSDTTLSALTVSNSGTNYILTPTFTAGSTEDTYSTVVPSSVTSVDIAATMTTPGNILPAGLGTKTLNVGDNSFTFTATAEDGTTKIYTINVKRLDNNTKLSTLTLSDISFTFNSDTNTYNLTAPYKTSSTTVSATLPAGSKANIDSGTGSWNLSTVGGVNTRKVVIKAEDCAYTSAQVPGNVCTTGEYTLNVTRNNPNNSATLSSLNVDGSLIVGFDSATQTYTLSPVKNNKTSINVSATATDSNATIVGVGNRDLIVGDNTIDIIVTAEDGTTQKTYTINIKRQSNTAILDSLTITSSPQGVLNPSTVSPITKTYTYIYDESVTNITVNATATAPGTITSGIGTFNVSNGKTDIIITAEDGTTEIYTVNFVRKTSSDKSLSSLKVSYNGTEYPVSPSLSDSVLVYNVTIPHEVSSVDILAIPKSSRANVTSGNGTVNNIEFDTLSRSIIVKAEDTTTETYTLNITRQKSNNANLTDIKVDGVSVSNFNKNTIDYTLQDVNGDVNKIEVTFTKENQYSNVVVTGNTLVDGNNQVKITVTSQDGSETKVYTLNVKKKSSVAKLSSLTLTSNPQGVLNPSFNPDRTTYNYLFEEQVTNVNISATAAGTATVISGTGNHTPVSGESVSIVVEAEDGTRQSYNITFNRKSSSDSSLASLTVSNGTDIYPITPQVSDGVKNYSVTIPHDVTSVNISAIPKSSYANVASGNGLVDNIGFTPINRNIVIKAEDTTTSTYVLTINREKSNNADLSTIELDGTELSGFDKDILEYNLTAVDSTVTSLNLTYNKVNQYANASIVAGTNNLIDGDNTVIIRVVSQDGSVTKEYKVHVRRKSSDTTLSGLTITSNPQGTYTPTFNKLTKEYVYKYDRSVSSVVINATVDGNKVVTGNGTYSIPDTKEITLEVTAEDENIKESYKIKFEQILESDSTLKSLTVSSNGENFKLNPNFNPSLKNYSLTVEGDVDEVLIEAEPNSKYAKATGTGTTSLVSGGNFESIVVTAEDGTTTTYTLNITRKINTSATVTEITIGGEVIDGFNPNIATYDLGGVPYDTSTIDLGAKPTPGATLSGDTGIQNLEVGDNTFEINVTAQDGVTTGKYTIKVRRKSNDYSLSNLLVTSSPSSSVRKDVNGDYTIDVPSGVETISIEPITNHNSAIVTNLNNLNDIDITNITYIDVEVQAEDELYSGTHRVKINKLKSTNVYLSSLTVNQGTLTPVFNKEITSYTVNVGTDIDTIILTGVAEDSKSTVLGDGTKSLNPGDNTFVITVQAEDGTTSKDYTVVVTKEQKSILTLSDLAIDGVTIDDFSPSKTDYTITVPYSKNNVEITAVTSDSSAKISGNGIGNHVLNQNSETFMFIVTAEDGSTRTYQVTINKENPDSDNTLTDLVVEGYPLNPEFNPNEENYNIGNVSDTTDSLTVNVTPGSDKSTIKYKVNGTEVTPIDNKLNIPSNLGPGTIEVIVTAEDGTEKTYTIRYDKTDGSDTGLDKITSVKMADGITDMHDIDDNYILTGRPETSWEDFKVEFLNEQSELFIFNNDGLNESTAEITRTGDMVKLIRNGVVLDTKYIIIKGDTNGDGKVKIADATRVVSHLMKTNIAEGAYLRALDVNDDGNVKIADATRVVSHLMKTNPFVYYKEINN